MLPSLITDNSSALGYVVFSPPSSNHSRRRKVFAQGQLDHCALADMAKSDRDYLGWNIQHYLSICHLPSYLPTFLLTDLPILVIYIYK